MTNDATNAEARWPSISVGSPRASRPYEKTAVFETEEDKAPVVEKEIS
jgi:hypothetical protein